MARPSGGHHRSAPFLTKSMSLAHGEKILSGEKRASACLTQKLVHVLVVAKCKLYFHDAAARGIHSRLCAVHRVSLVRVQRVQVRQDRRIRDAAADWFIIR